MWLTPPNIYPQDYLSVLTPTEDTQIKLNNPVSPSVVFKEKPQDQDVDELDKEGKLIENTKFFSFAAHDGDITALIPTADGLGVFSAGADGKILYSYLVFKDQNTKDLATATLYVESLLASPRSVFALSLSPDGRYLAIGQFSLISVLDMQERRIIAELTRVEGRITSLAWDPEGKLIALGRAGGDIFVWPFKDEWIQAENRLDKLEHYSVGSSPIVKIIFHPSGRMFFTAEKSGGISAWRLLRTESEIGLRDEDNIVIDRKKEGNKRMAIGQIDGSIEDLYLVEGRNTLVASTSDGRLMWWKIRGAQKIQALNVGAESIFALVSYRRPDNKFILISTLRSQVIKFWCDIYTDKNDQEQVFMQTPKLKEVEFSQENINKYALFAETPVFSSPVSFISHVNDSKVLWVAQKTGNLLAFNVEMLNDLNYCY
ncbi:MAG: hypothetical protein IT292_11960 [Deltaproteobacteria bacterium]|nr:hypothetical protein [Deltaproteobacteria bacterium]